MHNDDDLILRLTAEQTKDSAFKELLSLYKERLYWHVRKIVISHDDADDVLQETFIKIYRNIHNFKGESKLFSWMYRIATNEALTHLKKNANLNNNSSQELHEHTMNNLQADVYFEGSEIQLKLQKAIATLPEKQKLVFNMRYFDDIKYSDMSEILDTSEGALKATYHIAVKKVEEYLTTH